MSCTVPTARTTRSWTTPVPSRARNNFPAPADRRVWPEPCSAHTVDLAAAAYLIDSRGSPRLLRYMGPITSAPTTRSRGLLAGNHTRFRWRARPSTAARIWPPRSSPGNAAPFARATSADRPRTRLPRRNGSDDHRTEGARPILAPLALRTTPLPQPVRPHFLPASSGPPSRSVTASERDDHRLLAGLAALRSRRSFNRRPVGRCDVAAGLHVAAPGRARLVRRGVRFAASARGGGGVDAGLCQPDRLDHAGGDRDVLGWLLADHLGHQLPGGTATR